MSFEVKLAENLSEHCGETALDARVPKSNTDVPFRHAQLCLI